MPDWHDKFGCIKSAAACKLQWASCFKKAGLTGAIGCFKYLEFCKSIELSCLKCVLGKCDKSDCKPPSVSTTTIVTPCAPTATNPPPTVCPPKPTNICKDTGSICGIPLPIVSCNDDKSQFAAAPFKLYNDADTSKCPIFPQPEVPNACAQACKEQYDQCSKTSLWSCHGKRSESPFEDDFVAPTLNDGPHRRTLGLLTKYKCKSQYDACVNANKGIDTSSHCNSWEGCY